MPSTTVTELPDYILARNAQAIAAGLRIERQQRRGDRLTTWYRGPESAWRASAFFPADGDMTFPRKSASQHRLVCFCPAHDCGRLVFNVQPKDGEWRASIANEPMPTWIEDIGNGVTLYELNGGQLLAYIGPRDAVLAVSTVPAELRARDWDEFRSERPTMWAMEQWGAAKLPGGRLLFQDFVGRSKRVQEQKRLDERSKYTKPGDLTKDLLVAVGVVDYVFNRYRRSLSVDGRTYSVADESYAALEDALGELRDAVRNARIIVQEPAAEQPSPPGRRDPAFRSFLHSIQCDNQPDGGPDPFMRATKGMVEAITRARLSSGRRHSQHGGSNG